MKLNLKLLTYALLGLAISGCITRQEIDAHIWLQSGIPATVCQASPKIAKSGIYRKLNNGKYEFISYCSPLIRHYLSIKDSEYEELLEKLLKKKKEKMEPL